MQLQDSWLPTTLVGKQEFLSAEFIISISGTYRGFCVFKRFLDDFYPDKLTTWSKSYHHVLSNIYSSMSHTIICKYKLGHRIFSWKVDCIINILILTLHFLISSQTRHENLNFRSFCF